MRYGRPDRMTKKASYSKAKLCLLPIEFPVVCYGLTRLIVEETADFSISLRSGRDDKFVLEK
jgi:hypothetical protein